MSYLIHRGRPCHDCCAEAAAVPEALDDDIQEAVELASRVLQPRCQLSAAYKLAGLR